eukprot:TRINITY_DN14642_c1_g2_i1.p1 TRINITY_DN14642_c1_g2~~TRINITY_DN14642_c1_g2_i1.p1  ORF type:complete len:328 (+),score=90.84 TRINITY_DN14642_c1_g2_i1:111-1094(+)
MSVPRLGQKISLISKSAIRYEGTLAGIDAERNALTLSSVSLYGTEDRPAPSFVPPGHQTYDFIVFRGNDIKDLTVHQDNVNMPPADPAIVSASGPQPKGMPRAAPQAMPQPQMVQPMPQQTVSTGGGASYGGYGAGAQAAAAGGMPGIGGGGTVAPGYGGYGGAAPTAQQGAPMMQPAAGGGGGAYGGYGGAAGGMGGVQPMVMGMGAMPMAPMGGASYGGYGGGVQPQQRQQRQGGGQGGKGGGRQGGKGGKGGKGGGGKGGRAQRTGMEYAQAAGKKQQVGDFDFGAMHAAIAEQKKDGTQAAVQAAVQKKKAGAMYDSPRNEGK